MDIRSKARTLPGTVTDPSEIPKWNYDGSSTGQAPGKDSEVILYPQAIFKDPFRRGNNILVMCDCYTPAGEPIPTNKRYNAAKIFSHPDVVAEEPWYGIEQEYTLLQKDVKWPIGWPVGGFPGPQGPYYCSVGADKSFGRDVVWLMHIIKLVYMLGSPLAALMGRSCLDSGSFKLAHPLAFLLVISCRLLDTFSRGSLKLLVWCFHLTQSLFRETGMVLVLTLTTGCCKSWSFNSCWPRH